MPDPTAPDLSKMPPPPAAAPAPPAGPALPPVGPDEVALVIDDRPVVTKKGTTVLQAAETAGIAIPHYCYHPGLSIAGNCRMCLVEIEKMPKLQIGCATQAAQGMVVKTSNARVKATREGILEFLLINHPLDCPICDQAGECRLQEYSARYGQRESRFVEEKIHQPKRVPIGPRVVFDGERCIKCTRCIRFCDEVSKSHELGLFERGGHAIIGTFPGKSLDNAYSGNTVDVCPVGALTWKPFRFQARVWFLRNVPSVCTACARGCSVHVATYEDRIHRITPRPNPQVNGYWMCDRGRQSYEPMYERPRFERPLLRVLAGASNAASTSAPASAEEALDRAAGLLRATAGRHGAGSLAALVSARLTVEDLFLAKKTLALAGITRLVVPPHEEGRDDDVLLRRDATPNARGAALLGLGAPDAAAVAALLRDLSDGRVRGLVALGEDPVGEGLLQGKALEGLEALVVVDAFRTPSVDAAHVAFPACTDREIEGVVVNFEGQVQRLRRAVRPPGFQEPVWLWLRDLGRRFGLSGSETTAAALFDRVAAEVPAFAGMSYRNLGPLGRRVS